MKVKSSHLAGIRYKRHKLYVTFLGGQYYVYSPVPLKIYVRLALAALHGESVGKLFQVLVKDAKIPYRRMV